MADPKREVRDLMRAWRREELEARCIALEAHNEAFTRRKQHIQELCEAAGGHDFRALPDNGFNQPHFFTGEWPRACGYCDKRPPVVG